MAAGRQKTISCVTPSNKREYCYNVVFLFHCFMVITVANLIATIDTTFPHPNILTHICTHQLDL